MIAKYVSLYDLHEAAEAAHVVVTNAQLKPRGIRFRLGLDRETEGPVFQRKSAEGRRIAAVCWHGHRDFFRALFRLCPGAIIKTSMATYNGRAHFESTFDATGDINIGSAYRPLLAREACFCGELSKLGKLVHWEVFPSKALAAECAKRLALAKVACLLGASNRQG